VSNRSFTETGTLLLEIIFESGSLQLEFEEVRQVRETFQGAGEYDTPLSLLNDGTEIREISANEG
jgi:hypothetical protein